MYARGQAISISLRSRNLIWVLNYKGHILWHLNCRWSRCRRSSRVFIMFWLSNQSPFNKTLLVTWIPRNVNPCFLKRLCHHLNPWWRSVSFSSQWRRCSISIIGSGALYRIFTINELVCFRWFWIHECWIIWLLFLICAVLCLHPLFMNVILT